VKTLIVNADDFGWTEGVNRGIAEAHGNGIVSSASLLANGAAFPGAAELARREPRLGVGVHLNLSDGPPMLPRWEVPSLVSGAGLFFGGTGAALVRLWRGRLRVVEVEREWDAQIQKVRDAGIQPTHLDGHKHVHMLPRLFEIALRLARRHGIRAIRVSHEAPLLRSLLSNGGGGLQATALKQSLQARGLRLLAPDAREMARRDGIASADYFCGITQTGLLRESGVASLLANLPSGSTELMTHPGYAGDELRGTRTRLQKSRESELAILTAPRIRNLVASLGIRLVHYGVVAG
jgi:hopanoid biosynthesis associated protein HpnK